MYAGDELYGDDITSGLDLDWRCRCSAAAASSDCPAHGDDQAAVGLRGFMSRGAAIEWLIRHAGLDTCSVLVRGLRLRWSYYTLYEDMAV